MSPEYFMLLWLLLSLCTTPLAMLTAYKMDSYADGGYPPGNIIRVKDVAYAFMCCLVTGPIALILCSMVWFSWGLWYLFSKIPKDNSVFKFFNVKIIEKR